MLTGMRARDQGIHVEVRRCTWKSASVYGVLVLRVVAGRHVGECEQSVHKSAAVSATSLLLLLLQERRLRPISAASDGRF